MTLQIITINKNINRYLPCFNLLLRPLCSTKKDTDPFDFLENGTFSPEEHDRILKTLNESPEDLSRHKVSIRRIKTISEWKKTRGLFTSLTDLLQIGTFSPKSLKEMCNNIVHKNNRRESTRHDRTIKNLLIPEMASPLSSSLQTAVAIHLDPSGIGWAKMDKSSNMTHWNFNNFRTLPTKMLPDETFNLAINILGKTPPGDVYIFEAAPSLSPQSQTKQGIVTTHNQQVELISMLMALINTSMKHNENMEVPKPGYPYWENVENRVFFLGKRIPARLFNTLIGREKVSAISAVYKIICDDPLIHASLPCSPVTFLPKLVAHFLAQKSANKELMAQALILGVSFMELCIHRNWKSYDELKTKAR